MKNHLVALLIPHYNNPSGLERSIISIKEKVDVFVIDDGSTQTFSEDILRRCCYSEVNICFIYLQTNVGIERALNKGLEKIKALKYKYVLRLDCGDINVNNRISKQVRFLEDHPDINLLGSWVSFFSPKNYFLYTVKPPIDHDLISKLMHLNCMFIHPSVAIRTIAIDKIGYYPLEFKAAEDYAYFFKFVKKFKTANYPEILVHIEANPQGISSRKRKLQVYNRIRIMLKYFYFGYYPIYGIVRNLVLYFTPLCILNYLKRLFTSEKS